MSDQSEGIDVADVGEIRAVPHVLEHLGRIQAAGGKVFAEGRGAVPDEMPGAYNDLDTVMAAQADLVETVRRFTSLATYKGVDEPSRRKKG